MRKKIGKLTLTRETLGRLEEAGLRRAGGGGNDTLDRTCPCTLDRTCACSAEFACTAISCGPCTQDFACSAIYC